MATILTCENNKSPWGTVRLNTSSESTIGFWQEGEDLQALERIGVPRGIRTPVTAVKGRCPRPG